MTRGQEILNSEEVEFLLEASGAAPQKETVGAAAAQQAVTMRGDLQQMPLGDIFQTLGLTKMEGVLRVCNPVEQRIVYFRGGNLRILVPNRILLRRLGQRLIQAGAIDSEQLRMCLLEQRRQGQPLSRILVESGCVEQDQIDDILALQTSEELFGLFTWRHGSFEFFKGPPQDEALRSSLEECFEFEINSLLLEVARRSDEWEGILDSIRSLDEVPIRPQDQALRGIEDSLRSVLEAIDGKRTYREICETAVTSEFEGARAARDLMQRGLIANADDDHLLALAQQRLEQGHAKHALMLAQTLCDRGGDRPLPVVQALAEVLRGAGEARLAAAVLLEAAQLQASAETALQLAQQARALCPRDLATISFLRTTMLAHLPTDAPEIEQTTLDLLDGLLVDGDVERLFAVVDETREIGGYTANVMVREARALAKKRDKDAAITVMLQAATRFEEQGDRRQQIELLELVCRLDRDRKDVQKQLQLLRSTPRARAVRFAAAAAAGLCLLGAGAVWWTKSARSQALLSARNEITALLADERLAEAAAAYRQACTDLGDSKDLDDLRQQVRAAEAVAAHKRGESARRAAAERLQDAGRLVGQGELAAAFAVYDELSQDADLRRETQEAAQARLDALQRELTDAAIRLKDQLPARPEALRDPQAVEEQLTRLQRLVDLRLCGAARSVLDQHERKTLPSTPDPERLAALVQSAQNALPTLAKAQDLLGAYEQASLRLAEQRRLDPIFKAALAAERDLAFEEARRLYAELAAADANTERLRAHFHDKLRQLDGILGVLGAIAAAQERGDHAAAARDLQALEASFPDIQFSRIVRLPVRIETSVPGASASWNGQELGRTPLLASYVPAEDHVLALALDGFEPVRMALPWDHGGALRVVLTASPTAQIGLPAAIDHDVALLGGMAFCVDRRGAALCLDLAARKILWRTETEDLAGSMNAPMLTQDLVVTTSPDGFVRAFDQRTGAIRWQRQGLPTDLPALALDGRIVVATAQELQTLSPADGATIAIWQAAAPIAADLAGSAHNIYVPQGDGSVVCLDARSMRPLWTTARSSHPASLAISPNGLITVRDDGVVRLCEPATGKLRWEQDLAGTPRGRADIGSDRVLVTLDDRIVALSLADGSSLWQAQRPPVGFGGPASLLGDRVAVPLRDGDLQVYGFASTAVLYRIAAEKDATIGGDRRSSVTLTSGKLAHVFTHLP